MPDMTSIVTQVRARAEKMTPVDVAAQLDRYQYKFEGNTVAMVPFTEGSKPLLMHDLALKQLSARIGVPYQYLKKCPGQLAALNLNYWAQNAPIAKETLFRTVNQNQVRAVLSQNYTALDDQDVIPMLADVLGDDEIQVQAADFGTDATHLRIVFPRTSQEVRVNDVVQTGLHFSNSEVGLRAVRVEALVYRLVCSNGAVRAEATTKTSIRHVGDPKRLKDFIHNAVQDAKSAGEELVRAFKASLEHQLNDPEKFIERVAASGGLTQDQFKSILNGWAVEGSEPTLFGVVNGITRAAQWEPTFEDRYTLERFGTALLNRTP
jgi:hypothetical protein